MGVFAWDGRKIERERERSFITKSPVERTVQAFLQIDGPQNDRVEQMGGRSLGVRLGSNVNFFQMKTRQHPYWLRALCEAGKPTLATLIQGNRLMLIRLGSWTQGKPVCERFSKLIFFFQLLWRVSVYKTMSITHAIRPKHLSVYGALWPGAGTESGIARAWQLFVLLPACLETRWMLWVWRVDAANAGSYLYGALLPPCLDFAATGMPSSSKTHREANPPGGALVKSHRENSPRENWRSIDSGFAFNVYLQILDDLMGSL